jgi:cation transport protein ChaC
VRLANGSTVPALTYIVDRNHEQYAGSLDAGEAAEIVSGAHGVSGENTDYVRNTLAHLTALGLRDPWMAEVAARMRQD